MKPGFRDLGFKVLPLFRALSTANQMWFYEIGLPGCSELPGFRNLNHGERDWFLKPGSTVL